MLQTLKKKEFPHELSKKEECYSIVIIIRPAGHMPIDVIKRVENIFFEAI